MRLRGIIVLALGTTACAAVLELGDFEVVPDVVEAGSVPETGAASSSSSSGVLPNEGGPAIDAGSDGALTDAEADASGKDASDGASPDAAVDAAPDANVNRKGTACGNTDEICSGPAMNSECCRFNTGTFDCATLAACKQGLNTNEFECDDNSDCVGIGVPFCCVDLGSDKKPKRTFCTSSCGKLRSCVTKSDCPLGLDCLPPEQTYGTALPLLKICR